MCLKPIGHRVQNFVTILDSVVDIIGGGGKGEKEEETYMIIQ